MHSETEHNLDLRIVSVTLLTWQFVTSLFSDIKKPVPNKSPISIFQTALAICSLPAVDFSAKAKSSILLFEPLEMFRDIEKHKRKNESLTALNKLKIKVLYNFLISINC